MIFNGNELLAFVLYGAQTGICADVDGLGL